MKIRSLLQNNKSLVIAVYLLLIALGIPWYLPRDIATLVFGFPLWAFISLLVVFISALFTAWLYLFVFTDDDP